MKTTGIAPVELQLCIPYLQVLLNISYVFLYSPVLVSFTLHTLDNKPLQTGIAQFRNYFNTLDSKGRWFL